MDYKTQILQELVEAVEKLNSPDLLSVGATVLAAVVAAVITYVLGKRQNELQKQQLKLQERQNELQEQQIKLQEQQVVIQARQNELQATQTDIMRQQTKAQEYPTYRGLYDLVSSIHLAAAGFVVKMHGCIVSKEGIKIYSWNDIREDISNLKKDLEKKTVDIELKFPQDYHRCETYKFILTMMETAVNRAEAIEAQGLINTRNLVDLQTIISNLKKGNTHMLNVIGLCVLDCEQKDEFMKTLIAISTLYKEECDSAFLDKIKSKI